MRAAYPGAGERGSGERPASNPPPDRADQIGAFMAVLRDQLGLQLDGGKQPVDVLVVDHAARSPTGN
jgi:uncharacterized protein (TIGR03435 family)